jgi:hypothetical protein
VFILRPDEDLMKILEQNTHLQVELLNRLDDFLAHNARSKNLPTVTIEYWPTLYNS